MNAVSKFSNRDRQMLGVTVFVEFILEFLFFFHDCAKSAGGEVVKQTNFFFNVVFLTNSIISFFLLRQHQLKFLVGVKAKKTGIYCTETKGRYGWR